MFVKYIQTDRHTDIWLLESPDLLDRETEKATIYESIIERDGIFWGYVWGKQHPNLHILCSILVLCGLLDTGSCPSVVDD